MQDALTENHFHVGECTRTIGPKGGEKVHMVFVRRTGTDPIVGNITGYELCESNHHSKTVYKKKGA